MRLWTIHPKYLDTQGLLAVWREALLAQKVLQGGTKGYRNHPQLDRFKATVDPPGAIANYLRHIYEEALRRGYRFEKQKIAATDFNDLIVCTRGQLLYEWNHVKEKLKARAPQKFDELKTIAEPQTHPSFRITEGEVEAWEAVKET